MVASFLYILYFLPLLWLIARSRLFRLNGIPWHWLVVVFMARVACGELSWLIFTYSPWFAGSSDAFRYFSDGVVLRGSLPEHPGSFISLMTGAGDSSMATGEYIAHMVSWNRSYVEGIWNDNRTLVRLNALFCFLSGGNYHIHLLFGNILSLSGLCGIYRLTSRSLEGYRLRILFFVVFLIPSAVFWGSILSKESLAIFGFGMLAQGMSLAGKRNRTAAMIISTMAGILLMTQVKPYFLLLIFPLSVAWFINAFTKKPAGIRTYLFITGICLLVMLVLQLFVPAAEPGSWLLQKQQNFYHMMKDNSAVNPLFMLIRSESLWVLLLKSPLAFFHSLFAPFFYPFLNIYTAAAALENLVLWLLMVYLLFRARSPILFDNTLIFCILIVVFDFIVIGWISPSTGAIQRYRILSLPLLFAVLIHISNPGSRFASGIRKTVFRKPKEAVDQSRLEKCGILFRFASLMIIH
ncbi:MAG TPA: hypothetical protein P5531_09490 [Bacteroidales bacterium]|nr:hypothetical protein [Bacteroidales bacterium]HSA43439.1 hypothetical protein [Bacteroidales bacterium]